MIYPPGYDPKKAVQMIEYNGRHILCLSGTLGEAAAAMRNAFGPEVVDALQEVTPEAEWFASSAKSTK